MNDVLKREYSEQFDKERKARVEDVMDIVAEEVNKETLGYIPSGQCRFQ